MNKNGFIAAVSENKNLSKFKLPKSTVAVVIDAALEAIEDALKQGDEVRLVGFGNFFVAKRAAIKGHNPRTGEDIHIKASKTPKFRAGKLLKDSINGVDRQKK
jgi:DNA-binding protein HU-beta